MSRSPVLGLVGAGAAGLVALSIWRQVRKNFGSDEAVGAPPSPEDNDGLDGSDKVLNAAQSKIKAVSAEEARLAKMIEAAAGKTPPAIAKIITAAAPYLAWTVVLTEGVLWVYWKAFKLGYWVYGKLPVTAIKCLTGGIVCFFGGMFPTLIASAEAFTQSGWEQTKAALNDLVEQAQLVFDTTRADDAVDADGDGVADVDQISAQALLTRKTLLVLQTVDPDKIDHAVTGLATSWVAVAAVLKVEFARTIALAASIGQSVKPIVGRVMVPILTHVLPKQYHRWINVTVHYTSKAIGMKIAWYVQSVISAYQSSIRGALMVTRALLACAVQQGWTSLRQEDTMMDEYAGWPLAACGFYFQLKCNFALPYPANLLLWPFTAAETYIRWKITDDLK